MTINLKDMYIGDAGRVVGFDKSFLPYRQKMLAMGLTHQRHVLFGCKKACCEIKT